MKILLKIIGGIIAIPIIGLLLFTLARVLFCGPNKEVISIAKPVLKIVANDIVKNGISESLEHIEGIPYKLEGCSRKKVFKKSTPSVKIVDEMNKADFGIKTESCLFVVNNKYYSISLWFYEDYVYEERSHGKVKIFNKETYTGIGVSFDRKDNVYKYSPIGDGYAHYHGVLCGSFKQ